MGFEKINVYHDGGVQPFEPGKIIIEPLERGFAHTIGNAVRRILLSSMPGASVIGMKVSGIVHEFAMIPGAGIDATELILNLKKMRFAVEGDEIYTVTFKKSEAGFYTANDLELPANVQIENSEQSLIHLTGDREVEIEIYVENGRGYTPSDQIDKFLDQPEVITVDGTYSPIRKAGYEVEKMRIGQDTTYERLILNVTTDGSVSPKDAVMLAAKIATSHFNFFEGMSDVAEKTEIYQEKKEEENRILDLPIEHLDLSVRSYNCLKREGFTSVRKILALTESQLYSIHQLGDKSVKEIIAKIIELGLELKKD